MIAFAPERPPSAEAWIDRVTATGGNPMHLPEISRSEFARDEPLYLVAREGEAILGSALAFAVRRRRWGIPLGPRSLHLPTAPALAAAPPAARERAYDGLVAFARERGFRTLIIHARWGDSLRELPLFAPFVTQNILEFVLDCRRPLEAIEAGMHRFHRKNIRKAARDGLEIRRDGTPAGLRKLRELQLVSAERSARRGGGFGVQTPAYFEQVAREVYGRGLGEIHFAVAGEETVAGLAFLAAAGRALTVRSGATPEGYRTGAMYLLQASVIRRAVELGIGELNLGGVPEDALQDDHPQHGLHEFKKGFGGEPRVRSAVRMPLGPGSRR